jgi:O-antigen/teichoic acid export membrane protein
MVAVTAVLLRNALWQTQLVGCLAVAFGMYIGAAANVQTLLSRTATIARVAVMVNIALQVAVISSAEATHSGYATWTTRIAVANIGSLVLLLLLPAPLRTAVLRPLWPRKWPPGFVSFGVKTAIGGLVALAVFSRSEIFVLQADRQHAAAGVFALAFGIAAHMTAPIDALLGPMMPAAVSLVTAAPERLGKAVLRGLRFTAVVAGAIAATGIPLASALIEPLFGKSFEEVSSLVLPLALVSCIQSLNHPVTAFLYGLRKVGPVLAINLVAFSIDIGIAIATVGSLHAWGATIANVVGQLLALAGAAVLLKRALSLSAISLLGSMRTFVEGTIAATVAWLVVDVLTPSEWSAGARAGLGVVAGALIFLALQRFKDPVLTSEDVSVVVEAMPHSLRGPMTRTAGLLGFAP